MTEIFVDREQERRQLLDLATAVTGGTGGVYCVEGPAGIGKTALLDTFRETAAALPGLRISKVACHGQVGAENSYGPIIDLLATQPASAPARRWARRRRIAADLAPDLLELVPVAGGALKLGAQLVKDVIEDHSKADPNGLIGQVGRVAQVLAGALLRAAATHGPTLLVIDDAERIDHSSCIVLDSGHGSGPRRRPGGRPAAPRPRGVPARQDPPARQGRGGVAGRPDRRAGRDPQGDGPGQLVPARRRARRPAHPARPAARDGDDARGGGTAAPGAATA
ncbi:MAG: ATP-binding protein [Streptomyces sp.]|nr:ATP-binding protein [Streptomyces sp.]